MPLSLMLTIGIQVSDGLFRNALNNLEKIKEDPTTLLSLQEDIFGEPLDLCPLLEALRTSPVDDSKFASAAQTLAKAFISKLELQLERYLSGDLAEPSPELLEKTQNAPTHNIHAERTLGMMDALL